MGCVSSKQEEPVAVSKSPAKVSMESDNSKSKTSFKRQKSSRPSSASGVAVGALSRAASMSSRALTTHPSDIAAANIVAEAERDSIHDVIKIMSTIGGHLATSHAGRREQAL